MKLHKNVYRAVRRLGFACLVCLIIGFTLLNISPDQSSILFGIGLGFVFVGMTLTIIVPLPLAYPRDFTPGAMEEGLAIIKKEKKNEKP